MAAPDGETVSHERALCTGNKKGTSHLHAKMIRGLDEAIKKNKKKKTAGAELGEYRSCRCLVTVTAHVACAVKDLRCVTRQAKRKRKGGTNNFQGKEKITEVGDEHYNKPQNKGHKHNLSSNKILKADRINRNWFDVRRI